MGAVQTREAKDRGTAIAIACGLVSRWYDGAHPFERRWLHAIPEDSYSNPDYRTELWVREGSPPKGYVLIGYGFVLGFGNIGDLVCRVKFPAAML